MSLRSTVLLAAMAAIVAACSSGGGELEAIDAPTAPPTASATATPTASATPTSTPTPTPTPDSPASVTPASTPEPTGTPVPPPPFDPGPIVWAPCGPGLECGSLEVPLDYADPGGERITLGLARRPATDPGDRLGSVLVNPGGPGASGRDHVAGGGAVPVGIAQRFDVVGWDPRGAGTSAPIGCRAALDDYYRLDQNPDDQAEVDALDDQARVAAAGCEAAAGALLPHLGTDTAVADIDTIRRGLGEEQISFVGYSYGTYLGLRYLDAHPDRVRAMVLDGVVDPTLGFDGGLRAQAEAIEATLARLLGSCAGLATCPLAQPARAFDQLAARVETAPLSTPSGRPVGPSELTSAAFYATYDPASWPALIAAIAAGRAGDGTELLQMADAYRSFTGFDVYTAVTCIDNPPPVGPDAFEEFAGELGAIAPRVGEAIANELRPCSVWPVPPVHEPAAITAPGTPPVLVIGNLGDAATPVESARAVAEMLESAVLLEYAGEGHLSIGRSQCVDRYVVGYVVALDLPPAGVRC